MILPRAPRPVAEGLEARRVLPAGRGERFTGYGVPGLPFASGDVLALRRFTASSVGPPFTSIWHRSPDLRWTCYLDVEAPRGCPRYFGDAFDDVVVAEIRVDWRGSRLLGVSVSGRRLHWALRLRGDPLTWSASVLSTLLAPVARGAAATTLLRATGVPGLLARSLGTSRAALEGTTPNGQRYRIVPRALWRVEGSAGMVEGRELGPIVAGIPAAYVGPYPVATGALFAAGALTFDEGAGPA